MDCRILILTITLCTILPFLSGAQDCLNVKHVTKEKKNFTLKTGKTVGVYLNQPVEGKKIRYQGPLEYVGEGHIQVRGKTIYFNNIDYLSFRRGGRMAGFLLVRSINPWEICYSEDYTYSKCACE